MIRLLTKYLQHVEQSSTIYYTITDHCSNDMYISEEQPINYNYIDFETYYRDDHENDVNIPIDMFINNYINFYTDVDGKNTLINSYLFNKIETNPNKTHQLILQQNNITYTFIKINPQHKKSYSFNDLIDINNLVTKDIVYLLDDIKSLKDEINNHKYHLLYKYIYLDELTIPDNLNNTEIINQKNKDNLLLGTKYALKSPTNTQLHEDHNALLIKRKNKLIQINIHLKQLLHLTPLQNLTEIVTIIESLKDEELIKFNNNISNHILYLKIISQVLKVPLFYKNQKFVIKFKSVNSYGIIMDNDTGEKIKIIPFYINKDKNILNIKNFIIGYKWLLEYDNYLFNFLL